jgi:hypothetical protein
MEKAISSAFTILHSAFCIQKQNGSPHSTPVPITTPKFDPETYVKSPFSCSSWQSMQNWVQGTAWRRFSPMVAWQLVQTP